MASVLEDVAIIGAGVGVSASCFVASSTPYLTFLY